MTVSRPVIVDLWPLCESGEASPETRALVDAFLKDDPELASQLRRDPLAGVTAPDLPPDVEVLAFSRARRRLSGYRSLLFFAMMFSCMAFGRIVSDTSFDVSPRPFIAVASLAVAFWVAFCVSLWRMRGRILVVRGRGTDKGAWGA